MDWAEVVLVAAIGEVSDIRVPNAGRDCHCLGRRFRMVV